LENTEENCEMIWKIRKKNGWWWWWQTFVRNVIIEMNKTGIINRGKNTEN
jgi:hypothetical protein